MNPILALIIANVIWGVASPVFKLSLTNIPPFTLAFSRFFLASFIYLPFLVKKRQHINWHLLVEICISAFFGITINVGTFFLALKETQSINAPIIASAGPVIVYLLSVLFLKEKTSRKVFIGMSLSLLGVLIVVLSPILLDGKHVVMTEVQGNLLLVLSALGSVLNIVLNKDIIKKVNALECTYISFLFGALTFLPFMVKEMQSWSFTQLNVNGWLGLLFGIFLSSATAYFLMNYAMGKLSAQETGLFLYIDPLAAVLVAIPLIHEYPNGYFLLGSALVFGGIYIAERRINYHPLHKLFKKHLVQRIGDKKLEFV